MQYNENVTTTPSIKPKDYISLGFTEYQARKLTQNTDLNVRMMKSLLREGCPIKLAYRIYRP